jgi:hypothetical protein
VHARSSGAAGGVQDETLWGTVNRPATNANLNKKSHPWIEARRNRPVRGEHPRLHRHGIVLQWCWVGEVRNVSLQIDSPTCSLKLIEFNAPSSDIYVETFIGREE